MMMLPTIFFKILILINVLNPYFFPGKEGELIIKKSKDFEIDGTGSSKEWYGTSWIEIPFRHGPESSMQTRAKVLYSDKGLYFLFECEDEVLTATKTKDFEDLFKEDVIEVFLWPDEQYPMYFEYELSPLNYELPLLINKFNEKDFSGWRPWHYENERKVKHATSVDGGAKEPHSKIKLWVGEFFIPFSLLSPFKKVPPTTGTKWRANMYRIDYDENTFKSWQWQKTKGNFHEYQKFGTFIFE